MSTDSCSINDKDKNCCSAKTTDKPTDLSRHWNEAYANSAEEKLGWYETDLAPTLKLIAKTDINKSSAILNAGAGSTTLIDLLLENGYSNLTATDLSEIALENLENRLGKGKVECIVDDLTNPTKLKDIAPVDLWIDRAVLHFFTETTDRDTYFELLKDKVNSGGFVLMAEYNLKGVLVCSGLPVHRYSASMLGEGLGSDFELIEQFDHIYTMPSGAERPYIYTLFKRA